jgi:hypothetical protein
MISPRANLSARKGSAVLPLPLKEEKEKRVSMSARKNSSLPKNDSI